MYKVVLVEDEPIAIKKLKRLLKQVDAKIDIVAEFSCNKELLAYLALQPTIDLIFSDIELTDGTVFQSFAIVPCPCPIIFVTAYHQFMVEAFDTMGIAYLLKPYSLTKLQKVWQKFITLSTTNSLKIERVGLAQSIEQLNGLISSLHPATDKVDRMAIKTAQGIYFLAVIDIVYIRADGGLLTAYCQQGKYHYLPFNSLQKLAANMANSNFFRINRSEIIQRQYVERLERYCKNTFVVYLYKTSECLKTSQSRTAEFVQWIGL